MENLLSVAGGFLKGLAKQSDLEISQLPQDAVIYSIRHISENSVSENSVSEDEGNVWLFPSGAPQTLESLQRHFPEKPGNLIFRFLTEIDGMKVWVHPSFSEPLPRYRGRIIAQLTRVPVKTKNLEISSSKPQPIRVPTSVQPPRPSSEPGLKKLEIVDNRETYSQRTAREQRQQEAKVTAQMALSEVFDCWSKDESGKLRDVRTLIASLPKVLWAESGWEPINLGELMLSEGAVKKAWRRAVILCHPDKHQSASAEQQYRADRIFGAINESFKIFSEK
jgi:hypothetical protein